MYLIASIVARAAGDRITSPENRAASPGMQRHTSNAPGVPFCTLNVPLASSLSRVVFCVSCVVMKRVETFNKLQGQAPSDNTLPARPPLS